MGTAGKNRGNELDANPLLQKAHVACASSEGTARANGACKPVSAKGVGRFALSALLAVSLAPWAPVRAIADPAQDSTLTADASFGQSVFSEGVAAEEASGAERGLSSVDGIHAMGADELRLQAEGHAAAHGADALDARAGTDVVAEEAHAHGTSGAWDGTADVSWYDANRTDFEISTPSQLAGLAAIVNGTAAAPGGTPIGQDAFTGKTVRLSEDVKLNSWTPVMRDGSMTNWTPIGNVNANEGESHPDAFFNGVFDGQGHAVRNLYIDGNVTAGGEDQYGGYQGLFGALGANAEVRNLGIEGGWLYGRVVGGIAAISHTSAANEAPRIIGCFNTATIGGNGSSTRGTGGIFGGEDRMGGHDQAGPGFYRAAAYIANCYNTGTINGPAGGPCGGIAGAGMIRMYGCYSTGTVKTNSDLKGALIGTLFAAGCETYAPFAANGEVRDCYALEGSCDVLLRTLDAEHGKDAPSLAYDAETLGFLTQAELTSPGASARLSQSFVDAAGQTPQLYWQAGLGTVDLGAAGAHVDAVGTQRYTGVPVEPALAVHLPQSGSEEALLHEGSDYVVSYADNVQPGTATATVTGFGRMRGSLEPVSFRISDLNLQTASIDPIQAQWFYGEGAVEPAVTVRTESGTVLKRGRDYELAFTGNDAAGTATVTASAPSDPDAGSVSATFVLLAVPSALSGSGAASDPYLLSTKADLQFVAHQVNAKRSASYASANYRIEADIDASSSDPTFLADRASDPISAGSNAPGFVGAIDGAGHAVTLGLSPQSLSDDIPSGFSAPAGLALICKAGGSDNKGAVSIQNLTVKGQVTSAKRAAGFIDSASSQTLELVNCVNEAVVTGGDAYGCNASGIVGVVSLQTTLSMNACRNAGTVSAGTSAAGLVCELKASKSTFEGCRNDGAVTGVKGHAGGLVSDYLPKSWGTTVGSFSMVNCANTGAVTTQAAGAAGGLLAFNQARAPEPCSIAKSYNTGAITGGPSAPYVGGLVGQAYNTTLRMVNVYNTGTISSTSVEKVGLLGGLVGVYRSKGAADGTLSMQNAYNVGTIVGTDEHPGGALLGKAFWDSDIVIKNCHYDSESARTDIGEKSVASGLFKDPKITGAGAALDAAAMKSDAFVGVLGAAFDKDSNQVNNGFPILSPREVHSIADCSVAPISPQHYAGGTLAAKLTVVGPNGKQLKEGVDYAAFFTVRDGAGVATIVGLGAWEGSQTATFDFEKCSIEECAIEAIDAQNYGDNPGGAFTPPVIVRSPAGDIMVEGRDYTAAYANNQRAGTGLVLVEGKGDFYDGGVMRLFTIAQGDLSTCTLTGVQGVYPVSPYGADIAATITAPNGYVLGRNFSNREYGYVFIAADGTERTSLHGAVPGYYQVAYRGMGNWKGELTARFAYGHDLALAVVSELEETYTYTGDPIEIRPMLATAAGAPLVAARDYMLSFEDAAGNQVTSIVEPGAYTAVFSAHGRGTFGEQRVTFEVVKAAPADTAALAEAVASCDELLKATRASADGSDVVPAEFWATQEVLDAFDGAISAARGVLDAPGSDQAAVDAAVQELEQARAAFDSARKPGTHAGESPVLQRFAGAIALDTMSKVTGQFEETGGTVVLATMDGYWDALTAAGIAGGAAAPVLMTSPDKLSEQTAAELARLAPKRIVVCGGISALSEAVSEQAAKAAGGADVVRCAGEDAVGTANDVFIKAPQVTGRAWSNTALLCTNAGYWDALAAAPLAYAKALPIFLTSDADTVATETLEAMRAGGIKNVRIVGGEAAISRNVDSQLVKAGFQVGERLAGPSAVETSEQVAAYGLNLGMEATYVGAATVEGYWDALAGAPLCGKRNGVLLLASDVQHARESLFLKRHAKEVDTLSVFGGTSAVSEDTAQALLDAVKANR